MLFRWVARTHRRPFELPQCLDQIYKLGWASKAQGVFQVRIHIFVKLDINAHWIDGVDGVMLTGRR